MISDMTGMDDANILCKACGMCCTGHLFIWAKLRPSELDPAEKLGLAVFRTDPRQRGFSQPCPLWDGKCTVYDSPHYPHVCRAYKCKLLKEVLADRTELSHALRVVEQAMDMIHEVETLLPDSTESNFRQRLVDQLEGTDEMEPEFRQKAEALLQFYEEVLGVDDLVEKPDEL
jgi:hypothetical protein